MWPMERQGVGVVRSIWSILSRWKEKKFNYDVWEGEVMESHWTRVRHKLEGDKRWNKKKRRQWVKERAKANNITRDNHHLMILNLSYKSEIIEGIWTPRMGHLGFNTCWWSHTDMSKLIEVWTLQGRFWCLIVNNTILKIDTRKTCKRG